MKFALAGGGTGGHAYPVLAVAERLREGFDTDLVYYGTERGPERMLAEEAGIPFRTVAASQVRGRSPARLLSGLFNLLRGERSARRGLRDDRPDALFATGGYASAPIGRAARASRVPLLLFLPDVKPGWAVRYMQRHATTVACSVDASLRYLPAKKTVVTGYPVRRQFTRATREEGARHFDLDPSVPTVLITGGMATNEAAEEPGQRYRPRALAERTRQRQEMMQRMREEAEREGREPPPTPRPVDPETGRRALEHQLEFLRRVHAAGGRVLPSTDTGAAPLQVAGFALHRELALLVRGGIAASDVLQAATRQAAEFLGRGDDLGTIEAGKLADVLIVDGDPLTDIEASRRVVTVFQDGVRHDPQALLDRIDVAD